MAELAFDGVEEGSPMPAGRPVIIHSMTPPTESRSFLAARILAPSVRPGPCRGRQRFFFQSLQGFCCFPDGIERLIGNAGQAQDMGADGNAVAGQDLGTTAPAKTRGAVRRPEK